MFSCFVEAFEITAAQRGAPRWETADVSASRLGLMSAGLSPRHHEAAMRLKTDEDLQTILGPRVVRFLEVDKGAFKTHLPLVGGR